MEELIRQSSQINSQLARYGVRFGIYKNGVFNERLFPFDAIPRTITSQEFKKLEQGVCQRVAALNLYLKDIYSEARIVKDGVIPAEFVYSSSGYLTACEGITPPKDLYAHISGIDLVQSKEDWYVLEDNLRIPSGASYPLIARDLCRKASPRTFQKASVVDSRNYADLLRGVMDHVNCGGINVVFTPGRYNAAYFEHSYLAERTNSILAESRDLYVENDVLWYQGMDQTYRVGALYRRVSDEYLDPVTFLPESLIGVPNLMAAYRAGNVAILNAPGNGTADDKGIYYFVPKMIRYYLGEEPLLNNAPTYLPCFEEDRKYILEHLDQLVIKDVAEAGGYGILFGRDLTHQQLKDFAQTIQANPRRFIAQEVINFLDLPVIEEGMEVMRKADLRVFALAGEEIQVWPSGLTRFSRDPDSFIVNSSQGGGFKDTWVLK